MTENGPKVSAIHLTGTDPGGPPDPIAAAKLEAACDQAIEEMRQFRMSDSSLQVLWQYAQQYPQRVGSQLMYLVARWIYNQQTKAYIDRRFASDATQFIKDFEGTYDAKALECLIRISDEAATSGECNEAANYFAQAAEQHDRRIRSHFDILSTLAAAKAHELMALESASDDAKQRQGKVIDELQAITANARSSVVLRELVTRFSLHIDQ